MSEAKGNQYFPAKHVQEHCDFTGPIVPPFDENEIYIPVFATCPVPEDYLRALFNYAKLDGCSIRLIPIVEDDATLQQDVRSVTGEDIIHSVNFEGWSRSQLFQYFEQNLAPPEGPLDLAEATALAASDAPRDPGHFASFTIAVIDPDCLDPKLPGLKISTKAPDLGDDLSGLAFQSDDPAERVPEHWQPRFPRPALRTFMSRLDTSMSKLARIEGLTATFTELSENRDWILQVHPPAWEERRNGKRANPALARRQRWYGLLDAIKAEEEEKKAEA